MAITIRKNIEIALIGPKHSGKTVYLSSLEHGDGYLAAKDENTIALMKQHWNTIISGNTPPATSGTITNLFFSYSDNGKNNVSVSIPDYDGHFAETLSQNSSDSGERKKLKEDICDSHGFIVLMPADTNDRDTMQELQGEIGCFINLIRDVHTESEKINAPLVIVVNKWDKNDSFKSRNEYNDASQYVASVNIYHELYNKLSNYFSDVTIIPVSAFGYKNNTPDENPNPSAIRPYLVNEPIKYIINRYFDKLDQDVDKYHTSGDYYKLAEVLILNKELWSRSRQDTYQPMLDDSLERVYQDCHLKLSKTTSTKEFDIVAKDCSLDNFKDQFTLSQANSIDDIRRNLNQQENIRLAKRLSCFGIPILLLTFLLIVCFQYNSYYKKYTDALLTTGTSFELMQRKSNFVKASPPIFLPEFFVNSSIKKEKIEGQLLEIKATVNNDYAKSLEKIEALNDSCSKEKRVRDLLSSTADIDIYISKDKKVRANSILNESKDICSAASILNKNKINQKDLEKVNKLLANKANTTEKSKLMDIYLAKSEELEIKPLMEEINNLPQPTYEMPGFAEASEIVNKLSRYNSSRAKSELQKLNNSMNIRFYYEILSYLSKVHTIPSDEYYSLKELIRNNFNYYHLNQDQIEHITDQLDEKISKEDREKISLINDKPSTLDELKASSHKINELSENSDIYTIDPLYRYRRPNQLQEEIKSKKENIDKAEKSINDGIDVKWILEFDNDKNALGVNNNFGIENNEVSFYTPSYDLMSYNSPRFKSRSLAGDTLQLIFGDAKIKPWNDEEIRFTEKNTPTSDKVCTGRLTITSEEILDLLYNKDTTSLTKNFYSCYGMQLKLER